MNNGTSFHFIIVGDDESMNSIVNEKLIDAQTPGSVIEFSPDEAITVGAFLEDALSTEDALDSTIDLLEEGSEENHG